MAVAFSTDGSSVIERKLNVSVQVETCTGRTGDSLQTTYQLHNCKNWIQQNGYKKVALQFPDELLGDAAAVVKWLEGHVEDVQFFVLADTSYGSCCVDEVSAEHSACDSVIHIGHSCLSPTKRLPVCYVFGQAELDVKDCCEKTKLLFEDRSSNFILVYDVRYHHIIGSLFQMIKEDFPNAILSYFQVEGNAHICSNTDHKKHSHSINHDSATSKCIKCGGRILHLPDNHTLEDYSIYHIGHEGLTLTNLMMNWNKCTFYTYEPITRVARKETVNVNKMLMKRYFMVEKAKDASIVGILVGTLGVTNYLQVINRMKSLLKKVGKKYYTFVVGKLNVAKLANFMEVDIYVYVSCAENSLIDSSEFYRPIVTPYEMELACNPDREWTGEYVTSFQQLLSGGDSYVALPEGNIEESTDVSLVTGGMRQLGVKDKEEQKTSTALLERQDNKVALSGTTAGEFLDSRSWKGLEPQLGKTPVVKATEGRKGIAIGYEEEQHH